MAKVAGDEIDSCGARVAEVGVIEGVEGIGTENQAVILAAEREGLAEAEVDIAVVRAAQLITLAEDKTNGAGEGSRGGARIFERKDVAGGRILMRIAADCGGGAGKNRGREGRITGTIGGGIGVIRRAGLPGRQAADLPATDDFVRLSRSRRGEGATASDGKVVDEVAIKDLTQVEV